MISEIPLTPCRKTSSATVNASVTGILASTAAVQNKLSDTFQRPCCKSSRRHFWKKSTSLLSKVTAFQSFCTRPIFTYKSQIRKSASSCPLCSVKRQARSSSRHGSVKSLSTSSVSHESTCSPSRSLSLGMMMRVSTEPRNSSMACIACIHKWQGVSNLQWTRNARPHLGVHNLQWRALHRHCKFWSHRLRDWRSTAASSHQIPEK